MARKKMESENMKVVYAHTDSIYVPVKSIESAEDLCEELNEHIRSIFPNLLLDKHPVTLEFEKFYSSLGIGNVKNRNAGYISWKDGYFLSEPEFVVTGFEMKRIGLVPIAREVQERVIKMWVEQKTHSEIISYLKEKYNDIKYGNVSVGDIISRSRLRQDIFKYKTFAGGVAGALYYNQHINPHDPISDSYLYFKCKSITGEQYIRYPNGESKKATYVSFKELGEISDAFIPDWDYYANLVLQKAEPIFDAMRWDISKAKVDKNQRSLEEWF